MLVKRKTITLHDMRLQAKRYGSEVARLCGVSYQSLRSWEKGITVPNVINVHDLLQLYGYAFEELDTSLYIHRDNISRWNYDSPTVPKGIKEKITLYDMRLLSPYTGSAIAETLDVSYRTLRNWEVGTSIPNIAVTAELLQMYGYSFFHLDLTPFRQTVEKRSSQKEGQRKPIPINGRPLL